MEDLIAYMLRPLLYLIFITPIGCVELFSQEEHVPAL